MSGEINLGTVRIGTAEATDAVASLAGRVLALTRSLLEAAQTADQTDRAAQRLGSAFALVQQATNDTVTAQEALRAQQSLVQSGLDVTAEQLAAITRRARDYALATGTETPQALEQLTDALRAGEAEGLRRFGVAVEQGAARTDTYGSALRRFTDEQRATGAQTRTLTEDTARLERGWGHMIGELARSVTQLAPVRDALASLGGAVAAINEHVDNARNRERQNEAAIAQGENDRERIALMRRVQFLGNGEDLRGASLAELRSMVETVGQPDLLDGGNGLAVQSARSLAEVRRRNAARTQAADDARRAEATRAMLTGAAGAGATEATTFENISFRPGEDDRGGGGTNFAQLRQAREEARRAMVEVRALNASVAEIPRRAGEHLEAYYRRVVETAGRAREAIRAQNEASSAEVTGRLGAVADTHAYVQQQDLAAKQARQQREAAATEQAAAAGSATDGAAQFRQAFQLNAGQTQTAAQQMATGVSGAFNTMSQAAGAHVKALIEGKEEVGEALRAILQETLTSIASESTVKALFNTAQGFAALATYRPAEAASHFTAAGIYAAVAVATGAGAAGLAALGPKQAAGGGASPRSGTAASAGSGASPSADGGNTTYVINVDSALATREDVQDVVRQAQNGSYRRGLVTTDARRARQARAA